MLDMPLNRALHHGASIIVFIIAFLTVTFNLSTSSSHIL